MRLPRAHPTARARSIPIGLFAALLLTTVVVPAAPHHPTQTGVAAVAGPEFVPGEVIVKFRPGLARERSDRDRDDLGARSRRRFRSGAEHWLLRPGMTTGEAIERLRRNPNVQYVEPNYILRAQVVPDDPRYPELWSLHNTGQTGGTPGADIRAEFAWEVTTGSRGVVVAVIDSGIDDSHPDLAANIYSNPGEIAGNGLDDDGNGFVDDVHGWDFRDDDNDPFDALGHGTHVAGIIGAAGNNALGVTGICWAVSLVPIRFVGADGTGTSADAIAAIDYATLIGADIANNSWGGDGFSQALFDAIRAAGEAGVLFVASAGNEGRDSDATPHYPSGYNLPNVVSVAATDHDDNLARFSNFGAQSVDLAAPGVSILSTLPGGAYGTLSGTSMAAPHVSGVAALILALDPNLDVTLLRQRLLDSADRIPALAGRMVTGARLNALRPIAVRETNPPGAIDDLTVESATSYSLALAWTATGDDGDEGSAESYDLRYATSPIDAAGFAAAARVPNPPAPLAAGAAQRLEVGGLGFATTYYFALVAIDEWGNAGPLSNLASGTTLGPPAIAVRPATLEAEAPVGGSVIRTLTIENHGSGHLVYDLSVRPPGVASLRHRPAVESARIGPGITVAPRIATVVSGGLRILLLHSGSDVTEIRALLAAFPDISTVDVLDGSGSTPTLAALRAYDVVVVIVTRGFGDPDAVGDRLADYADAGGGVVLTLASFVEAWAVQGRFLADGYHPLLASGGPVGTSVLGYFVPGHPIMEGVVSALGHLLAAARATENAETVGFWSFGWPAIATHGTNIAAMNIYVGDSDLWLGDVPLILHNAAVWTQRARPWIEADATRGVVPPGGTAEVALTFDARRLSAGTQALDVVIESNDPDAGEVVVPARLRVVGIPDIALDGEVVDLTSTVKYGADGARTEHVLSVAVPPAGDGVLDLVADGDYGDPSETATLFLGGVRLGSTRATAAACGPARRSFTLDRAVLETLVSDGQLPVEVRNTADVDATCKTNAHTVRLRYTGPADSLDFGATTEGTTRSLTLTLTNTGTDILTVREITSDSAAFTPEVGGIVLAAGERRTFAVRFTPPTVGPFAGMLRIVSDDPDEGELRVGLTGQGLGAPDIDMPPVSFDVTLPANERTTRTFTVANHGGSPLLFDFLLYADAATSPGGPTTTIDLALVADGQPYGMNSIQLVLEMNGLPHDSIYADTLATTNLFTYPLLIVPSAQSSRLYNALIAQAAKLETYVSAGGILVFHAAGDGLMDGNPTSVTLPGGVHVRSGRSTTSTVTAPGHPLVAGLPSVFPAESLAYFTELPAGATIITRDDQGRPNLVEYRLGRGRVIAGGHTYERAYTNHFPAGLILSNMIPYTHWPVPAWLSVSPRPGAVQAGGATTVTLTFDGRGMVAGDYGALATLHCNDPDEPDVLVPVRMHVVGVPDIRLSRMGLDFASVFVGFTQTMALKVFNDGTGALSVDLGADQPQFTVAPTHLVVPVGQSRIAVVGFRPDAPGLVRGSLTLLSDDPDEASLSVTLSGTGLERAVIEASPASLAAEVLQGRSASRTITIANTGLLDLAFAIALVSYPGAAPHPDDRQAAPSWLSITPASGVVPPGGRIDTTVTFTGAGLYPTIYGASLLITSDDPMTPVVAVPATLTVVADSDGDQVPDSADDCPGAFDPAQQDADGDLKGDACDDCPGVADPAQEDRDHDGIGSACDSCPFVVNRDQTDSDADLLGDDCDNCPATANPDQADGNRDGSGDACQPTIVFTGARQDGGPYLEVRAEVGDPQGDPLGGRLEITGSLGRVTLRDALPDGDCSSGFLPDGIAGRGIGFVNGSFGAPFLFDLDSLFYCGDGRPDYLLALGDCDAPAGGFDSAVALDGVPLPASICLRQSEAAMGGLTLGVLDMTSDTVTMTLGERTLLQVGFDAGLPRGLDLAGLEPGAIYELRVTVTDGSTLPVQARLPFLYQGEGRLVFNHPPRAAAPAPAAAECDRPAGAIVTLDGRGARDADDDPLAWRWLLDPGTPTERTLGTGALLEAVVPVGEHTVVLEVTDPFGESDRVVVSAIVTDTVAPELALTATPTLLWPPDHALRPVHLAWTARDLCDAAPVVALVGAVSSEPDDAPGTDDGHTDVDIAGAGIGSPDMEILLRAERAGAGPGRHYDINYRVTDAAGNTTLATARVVVPHDAAPPR